MKLAAQWIREHGQSGNYPKVDEPIGCFNEEQVKAIQDDARTDLQSKVTALLELADIGKRWREDSSLEKWFPITTEELELLKSKLTASEASCAVMREALVFLRDEIDYESNEEAARAVRSITLALGSDAGKALLEDLSNERTLSDTLVSAIIGDHPMQNSIQRYSDSLEDPSGDSPRKEAWEKYRSLLEELEKAKKDATVGIASLNEVSKFSTEGMAKLQADLARKTNVLEDSLQLLDDIIENGSVSQKHEARRKALNLEDTK